MEQIIQQYGAGIVFLASIGLGLVYGYLCTAPVEVEAPEENEAQTPAAW